MDLRPLIYECIPYLTQEAKGMGGDTWNFGRTGQGLPILSANRIRGGSEGHIISNMFYTTVQWNHYLADDDLEYVLKHDKGIKQLRELNIHNWHKGLDDLHPIFQTYSPSQLFPVCAH